MLETVEHNGKIYALIMRNNHEPDGVNFITSDDNPLQLGFISHKKGYEVKPHIHKPFSVAITELHEVLHLKEGSCEAAFYDNDHKEVAKAVLHGGDTILLTGGGHGFRMLEDCKMIEVKQGPYRGVEQDKERL